MSAAHTRGRIIAAAVRCARRDGVQWITRDQVAAEAKVSAGLVSTYFKPFTALKRAVFAEAVKQQLLPLIAQGLADGNEACKSAPLWLREKALGSVV